MGDDYRQKQDYQEQRPERHPLKSIKLFEAIVRDVADHEKTQHVGRGQQQEMLCGTTASHPVKKHHGCGYH